MSATFFFTDCPLYKGERNKFFHYISIVHKIFMLLTKKDNFWGVNVMSIYMYQDRMFY